MAVTALRINYMVIGLIIIWILVVPLLIKEYKNRESATSKG